MKRAALLVLALAAGAAGAAPLRYTLDPDATFAHFEVLHFGTSTLRGRIGPVRGEVVLDRAAGTGELGLRIATASVDTGMKVLDARLRKPDLFDSEGTPEAFFVSRRFRFEGEALAEVRGEFTLRGTSVPLSLRALRFACRPDAERGGEVCGGDFEGFLQRSEFGMTYLLPLVADRVRLQVQVEAFRR
ncbi:MAG: YceI family protein [Rubrivivax sp.]